MSTALVTESLSDLNSELGDSIAQFPDIFTAIVRKARSDLVSYHLALGAVKDAKRPIILSCLPEPIYISVISKVSMCSGFILILIFCRRRLRASAGAVRLSERRECLSQTPTNAEGCTSPVS
ncbi:MAG: hypothetical protein MPJ52_00475 [Alphaproteobacteria bacterium]|nr:hypothetical protein [Alphaproteobacteria bacterium]